MNFPRLAQMTMAFCLSFPIFAQDLSLSKKDSIVTSYWLVTLGTNIVDDSGHDFGRLLDIKDGWNMVPFPSRFSVGRYFRNGIGLEAVGTYNKYTEGKVVDEVVNPEDIAYFGLDFRINYDLNMILGDTGFFDPYVGIGAGYTDANHQGRGTYNAVVGFRTWFSDRWGLDFSSTGKWSMDTENASNHLQHAVGVAYRFEVEKDLSRKGAEKLALLEELDEAHQKKQDSIAQAERNAQLLAERLQREKEAAALAAEEQAKKNAEKARRTALQTKINHLGMVYFNFNSSYLTPKDKEILDELVSIMQAEPTLAIRISAHTDSRGTNAYNQWLSERRAERTVAYIISKGIPKERLSQEGFGETQLVNQCGDGVKCDEEKHAKNRRSEILIVKF